MIQVHVGATPWRFDSSRAHHLLLPQICWDGEVIGLSEGAAGWELILASGSPRRRDLLREAGLSFQIVSPEVVKLMGALPLRELALANARLKCMAVSMEKREVVVIGADTVLGVGSGVFPLDNE